MSATFDAVFEAWDKGEADQALEALAALWFNHPCWELTVLFEDLSRRQVRARRSALLESHGPDRVLHELLAQAHAGDRVAVHALLPWLVELRRARGRLRLTLVEPVDPVIARALGLLLLRRPELAMLADHLVGASGSWRSSWAYDGWLAQQQHWWTRELDATQRGQTSLVRARARHRRRLWGRLPIRGLPSPDLAEHRERLDRLALAVSPDLLRTRALFAAVYAEPERLELRAPLADHLAELGDPRGEFINLQLMGPDHPPSERERELLDHHGFDWLGPQGYLVRAASFEGGFLDRVALEVSVPEEQLDLVTHEPSWATLTALDGATWAMVSSPHMRTLVEVRCDEVCARRIIREGNRFPKLRSLGVWFQPENPYTHQLAALDPRAAQLAALDPRAAHQLHEAPSRLSGLEHLEILRAIEPTPANWRWLWTDNTLRSAGLRILGARDLDLGSFIAELRASSTTTELHLSHHELCYRLAAGRIRVTRRRYPWRHAVDRHDLRRALERSLASAEGRGMEIELEPNIVSLRT